MNLEKQTSHPQKNWYYLDAQNTTQGPFQEFALKNFISENIIQTTTYIWCEGMPEWKKYHDIFDTTNLSTPISPFNPNSIQNPIPFDDKNENQVVFGPQSDPLSTQYQSGEVDLKYILFSFSGRLRRKHFWLTSLGIGVVAILTGMLLGAIHEYLLFTVIVLALIPLTWINIAMGMKRLHDLNLSGWFLLLNFLPYVGGLILLVLYLLPSSKGNNKYGPQP